VNNVLRNKAHQRGAAMVEMAIVIPVFLALVFAIIEFSLVIFDWSRVIESSRAGARYAIVNNAECTGVTGAGGMVCPGSSPVSCHPLATSGLLVEMKRILSPDAIAGENVLVTYACTTAGFTERPTPVLQVTVEVSNVEHHFIVPGLIGMDATITMPDQSTTRTSEDLYTTAED